MRSIIPLNEVVIKHFDSLLASDVISLKNKLSGNSFKFIDVVIVPPELMLDRTLKQDLELTFRINQRRFCFDDFTELLQSFDGLNYPKVEYNGQIVQIYLDVNDINYVGEDNKNNHIYTVNCDCSLSYID